jgi:hypothetical protein
LEYEIACIAGIPLPGRQAGYFLQITVVEPYEQFTPLKQWYEIHLNVLFCSMLGAFVLIGITVF